MKNRERYITSRNEYDLMLDIERNTRICPIRAVAGISHDEKSAALATAFSRRIMTSIAIKRIIFTLIITANAQIAVIEHTKSE